MIHVLTGRDDWALRARRAQLLADAHVPASAVERFDLSVDAGAGLTGSASTYSLFPGQRVLDGDPASELSSENAAILGVHAGDMLLILRGPDPLPAAVKRALGANASYETFPVPTGANADARIRALARERGIALAGPVFTVLSERARHDLPRVASVLSQLAQLSLTSPTLEQVTQLLGTAAPGQVPWPLADALDAGDVETVLQLADALEPVAVVNYLASRTGQLGRILEQASPNIASVKAVTGVAGGHRAQSLLTLAGRLGPVGVGASWDLIAAADRLVKVHPDPHGALDVLLVRLAELWSGKIQLLPRGQ